MLLRVQPHYPQDFWINLNLGYHLAGEQALAADAIGYSRAALAVYPRSHYVYYSIAWAFEVRGNLPEAEAACRKAADPSAMHYPYLAWIKYQRTGNLDEFSILS